MKSTSKLWWGTKMKMINFYLIEKKSRRKSTFEKKPYQRLQPFLAWLLLGTWQRRCKYRHLPGSRIERQREHDQRGKYGDHPSVRGRKDPDDGQGTSTPRLEWGCPEPRRKCTISARPAGGLALEGSRSNGSLGALLIFVICFFFNFDVCI